MGLHELLDEAKDMHENALKNHRCIVDGMPHWHHTWTPGCIHCNHEY